MLLFVFRYALDKKYRNIVAVSSIYEYLESEKCKTLCFSQESNNKGAYNIFEEELKSNTIIPHTHILDITTKNQRILQSVMQEATNTINRLVTNTNNISKAIINNQNHLDKLLNNSEISIYNQKQTNYELSCMDLINSL